MKRIPNPSGKEGSQLAPITDAKGERIGDACPKCGDPLELVYVRDDAQETDHCYNLYACLWCGAVVQESMWNDPGLRVLMPDGSLEAKA